MNKRPVTYLQTDPRWKKLPYRVKGEDATIGGSGCGPSAAAMILASMTGKTITPVDTCKWSVDHGYKALNAGTYYSYFVPQFAAYGIECKQLLGASLHNKPDHPIHDQVKQYLADGYYVIALMGPKAIDKNGNKIPGTWTSGGHYIVVWDWDDKVRINDSASTKDKRLNGDPATFRREVKQYWLVDAREYNRKDELDMDIHEAKKKLIDCSGTGDTPSDWAKEATDFCKAAGIFNGDGEGNYGWQQPITREAVAQIIYNAFDKAGLTGKMDS